MGPEWLAIGLIGAGTGITAYSQYQQGRMAEEQAEAQSAWQRYNAKVAERQAQAERQATLYEARQHRKQAKQLKAKQRALYAKSGVQMAGSPLLVAEDTAAELELDNLMLQLQGSRRQSRWKQRSILQRSKADWSRKTSPYYKRQGIYGATGSLLQGAGQMGYLGSKMGLFDTPPEPSSSFKSGASFANKWISSG